MKSQRTCLVVDDESSIRRLVRTILESHDFKVLEALNGAEALKLVLRLEGAFDLIVSDIEMPGGDGMTFVRHVRELHSTIPIVLVSGYSDIYRQSNPKAIFEFIEKPFTQSVLWGAVERAIQKRRP